MRGSRTKAARKELAAYELAVRLKEEEPSSPEILALSLGVTPRWIRRNLSRSTETQ